jgi:hypothetical protein
MARIDEETRTLIKQVAENLGASIDNFDDPEAWFYTVRVPTGTWHKSEPVTFTIKPGWDRKDTLHVSSSFPRRKKGEGGRWDTPADPYRYSEKRVEMNASVKKAPERIAREIEKRFKDRYMVYYQRSLEIVQSYRNAIDAKRQSIDDLLNATNGLVKAYGTQDDNQTHWEGVLYFDDETSDRVIFRVDSSGISVEARHLKKERALKIAKVLGDLALAQSIEKEVA